MTDQIAIMTETIRRSWCRDTSATPELWSPALPSRGQCAVTALVVQDILGGVLLRTTNFGESHYLNGLVDGSYLDLTGDQFEVQAYTPFEERSREYVLGNLNTVKRYSLLLRRIADEARHIQEHYATLTSLRDPS